jgi:hypothetical protein
MAGEMRDSVDWVDKGLDGLRKEIDGHFAGQNNELGELRQEVEHLIRQRPSIFARWGFAPLPKASLCSWERSTSSSLSSTPRTGLTWTDGRIADLTSHVRDASTRASNQVAEIKAQIKEFDEETSERRFHRQCFLPVLLIVVAYLGLLIAKGVALLLA